MVAPLAESLPEPSLRLKLRDELVRWALERGASTTLELPAAFPVNSSNPPLAATSLAFGADSPPLPARLRQTDATTISAEEVRWLRPMGKARQWLAQQDRAVLRGDAPTITAPGKSASMYRDERREQQRWWQEGALTPQAQQRLNGAACAVADQIPVEVLDFAEALEAFVVPPFLKVPAPTVGAAPSNPSALESSTAAPPRASTPAVPQERGGALFTFNAFVSRALSRLRGGRIAQAALTRRQVGGLVQTSPPRTSWPLWLLSVRPPRSVRIVPALPLLLCGGVVTRALTLFAALFAVLFSSSTSTVGDGDSHSPSRTTQRNALATAGSGP